MNLSHFRIQLQPSPEQAARLRVLQQTFAEVCNAIAGVVQASRCWHRVTLHHLAYKAMRERFPQMGSQMVCNAVYSVSRTSRIVYQGKGSPCHVALLGDRPLPLLHFTAEAPVYFDRHTLSLKNNQLSMYTLDGRLKFQLALGPQQLAAFQEQKLLEVLLQRRAKSAFELVFQFSSPEAPALVQAPESQGIAVEQTMPVRWPHYVSVTSP